ncbi:ABC-type branched-subunit amino acid transport system ATPase component [Rhodococcus sp. 27YEA15]|uniref:hypothetical protein n=1 Tax=Rhodococcus sp. 27YEA15 TaxID=3156259 RepID=UPI003C7CB606
MDSLLEIRDLAIGVHGSVVAEKVDLDVYSGQLVTLVEPVLTGSSILFDTLLGRTAPLGGEVMLLGARPSMRRPRLAGLRGLGHVKIGRTGPGGEARRRLRIAVDRDENLRSLLLQIPRLADAVRHRVPYVDPDLASALDVAVALVNRPRLLLVDELSASERSSDSVVMHRLLRLAVEHFDSGVLVVARSAAPLESIADRCHCLCPDVAVQAFCAAS